MFVIYIIVIIMIIEQTFVIAFSHHHTYNKSKAKPVNMQMAFLIHTACKVTLEITVANKIKAPYIA